MAQQVHSTGVSDVTLVNSLPSSSLPEQLNAPARVRKKRRAEAAAPTPAPDQAPDYEAIGVPPEIVAIVEEARLQYLAIGRLETGQVYDYGAIFATVHDHAPDQKTFATWSKQIFKLSRRGAENYVNVHRNLAGYRERFVRMCLPASALYALSQAAPDRIEEVATLIEARGELTVKEITALVATDDAAPVEAGAEAGGVAGLKAMITEKVGAGVPAFMNGLFDMLRDIHIALEPHRNGKNVEKGLAQAKLVHAARLAKGQLESLTWMARVPGAPVPAGIIHVLPPSREGRWYELRQFLDRMGGADEWPDAGEVGSWLAETVVPLFAWALGRRAEKAAAVVGEMAKAAEAEQAKLAKEKAKAKAAAQKERAKARMAAGKASKKTGKARPAAKAAEPIVIPVAAAEPASPPARRLGGSLASAIVSGIGAAEKRARVRVAKAAALEAAAVTDLSAAMASTEEEAASSVLQVAIDA
jgi:hypothetical protein